MIKCTTGLKYNFLFENGLRDIPFNYVAPFANGFIFKDIDKTTYEDYNKGLEDTQRILSSKSETKNLIFNFIGI